MAPQISSEHPARLLPEKPFELLFATFQNSSVMPQAENLDPQR
jgi:hypothetical protein